MRQQLSAMMAAGIRRPLLFPVMRHISSWIVLWLIALLAFSWSLSSDIGPFSILATVAGFLLVPPLAGWAVYRAVWRAMRAHWR